MFLGVVAAFAVSSQHPYFAIFWVNPAPVVRDPRRDAPHRGGRGRRRPVGPRLDDQARRAVPRRGHHRVVRSAADLLAADRRADRRLELGELHPDGLLDRRRDERRQLHRRARRTRRRCMPHRERRLLRVLLHARPRHRLEHLLQPRVVHRRRADRRVHRLPAAELEPREAVHGGFRRAHARPADGHVRDRDHRAARSRGARPRRDSAARSCSVPSSRSCCRSWWCCCRCWTSASPSSAA